VRRREGELWIDSPDTDTHRLCGTCGELKELLEFYLDGKCNSGWPRRRRDCKTCFKAKRQQKKRRTKQ